MKSWIIAALPALAFSFTALTAHAIDNPDKTPRKPVKRPAVQKIEASAGASAPVPTRLVGPAPAPVSTPPSPAPLVEAKPLPLYREDVTLEEMHRYHQ